MHFMGQYYRPVNIDRNEWLSSFDYGNGQKLMEHSYVGNDFVAAVERLLAGAWKGGRIVWAGDYADPETVGGDNLFDRVTDRNKIQPAAVVPRGRRMFRYLLNHDRRAFVDVETAPVDAEGFSVHPLPLLTAEGNGRGGGDYRRIDGRIGSWARQRIEAASNVPADYVEFDGRFIE